MSVADGRGRAVRLLLAIPGSTDRVGTVAQALADERDLARAPFLALAEEYERHAGLMRAQTESGVTPDVVTRLQSFEDAAASIRRALQ